MIQPLSGCLMYVPVLTPEQRNQIALRTDTYQVSVSVPRPVSGQLLESFSVSGVGQDPANSKERSVTMICSLTFLLASHLVSSRLVSLQLKPPESGFLGSFFTGQRS